MDEEFIGVKFESVLVDFDKDVFDDITAKNIKKFKELTRAIYEKNWAIDVAGNISIRVGDMFLITSAGCLFSDLKDDELTLVTDVDVESKKVFYYGENGREPSSEAILHYLIYKKFDCEAVLHCHAEVLTYCEKLSGYCTKEEHPYGTVELAKAAVQYMKDDFVILKNHGIITIGKDLDECMEKIEKIIESVE